MVGTTLSTINSQNKTKQKYKILHTPSLSGSAPSIILISWQSGIPTARKQQSLCVCSASYDFPARRCSLKGVQLLLLHNPLHKYAPPEGGFWGKLSATARENSVRMLLCLTFEFFLPKRRIKNHVTRTVFGRKLSIKRAIVVRGHTLCSN